MMKFVVAVLLAVAAVHHCNGAAIGIDLGTTYSCVGVYKNGQVHIVPNDQGNRITASWVAFTPSGDRLIGDAAKNQAAANPKNTVYDAKRLIGRLFEDPVVKSDISHLPFDVVNRDNKPAIRVERNGKDMLLSPEEISAMVLEKMKAIAEEFLGENVTDAVVTVPAYFNDAQRQATKDAGMIAGLNVLRVLNEPTAAAIAYGLDKTGSKTSKKVLVFDLGGGTLDVSLLRIEGGDFRVLATSGDTHLGGADFDQKLMDYFLERIKLKHNKDISGDSRGLAKLRREAEKAKRMLSSQTQVRVEIDGLVEGVDYSDTVTRAKFEELNKELFKKTIEPVKKVLTDSDIRQSEIDEYILVGGSTRIPYIQKLMKTIFSERAPASGVDPDEAVAYGAAVQAAVLSGTYMKQKVNLFDVTPLSLGIRSAGGIFTVILPRNTPTPAQKNKVFSTSVDDQSKVTIEIFEGERPLVKDNHFLGKFELNDIPPGPRGSQKVKVVLSVAEDGILNVTAFHVGHGSIEASITVDSNSGRLSTEQIKNMLDTAERNREEDRKVKENLEARAALEQYLVGLRVFFSDPLLEEGIEGIEGYKELAKLVEENLNGFVVSNPTKAECEAKKQEIVTVAGPVVDAARALLATKSAPEEDAAAGGEGKEGGSEREPSEDL